MAVAERHAAPIVFMLFSLKKITDVIKEVAKVKEESVEIIFHDMKNENFAKAGKLFLDI